MCKKNGSQVNSYMATRRFKRRDGPFISKKLKADIKWTLKKFFTKIK
jgi:hypothetical protein